MAKKEAKSTTVEKVIRAYVKARDQLAESRTVQKELEKDINLKLDRLSMWLKEYAEGQGVTSVATDFGTAYKVTKDWVRVGNWDEVFAFIKKTKNWQMLEKRIGKVATKEIMESSGAIPPGVEYSQEIEYQVRKPTKK
jgi:hypothetical protein